MNKLILGLFLTSCIFLTLSSNECFVNVYFNGCSNICCENLPLYPPHRSLVRSKPRSMVKNLHTDIYSILKLLSLFISFGTIFWSNTNISMYKYRFITLCTRTNTLPSDVNSSNPTCSKLNLLLLILSYIMIFDYYLVIFLPCEFFKFQLHIKTRMKLPCMLMKIFHCSIIDAIILATIFIYTNSHYYPYEVLALWYILLRLILSLDVHPNPGPVGPNDFSGGFVSFCNWNLNTLSKDNFYRITLLEAHNTEHNYDIISLCETSLNDTVLVPENALPGYKFHSCNHPDGGRNGGVGIFYKETLPLKIRHDLSFDECIVSEIILDRKRFFFTVLYRNPHSKAQTAEFNSFLENFENLYLKITNEKPYAMFFTGDFNGHSQTWYPEGDTNAEGVLLDNMFSDLNLTQMISEPTHIFNEHCNPSCIDLIVTDQPNIVLDNGVRDSLDCSVKHKITFCKINFKIPHLPKYVRKVWHFNRANADLIKRAISSFPWEVNLRRHHDPNSQVNILNQTILNIMSNFVPNEVKTVCPREPEWFNNNIKKLLRNQNKVFKRYKNNGYKNEDKFVLDCLRNECQEAIVNAKEKYLKDLGAKLADPTTGQKSYWKILNKILNKCKIPRIPPLFVQGKFITNFKEKADIFNDFFSSQCTPFVNNSKLPELHFLSNGRISTFEITLDDIKDIITGLNNKKAHGPDLISVNMVKLCGQHLYVPLKIIFDNILETGIFPDQWKEANVTPVHKKNDKQIISNYRPISLLPVLAKVFERIIFKHLYNYLISNDLITNNQSGFRPGDSCTNQLLSLVHDIHTAFDHRKCLEVRSVYLDMSKAFDKVWHEGLIFKLKQNGIEGNLLNLFQSYLADRKQRVVLNGMESNWGEVKAGVPQGSVLGPLLFLVYINDLEEGIKSSVKFFADDTSLFSIVHDPVISADELNHDLNLIKKWSHQWKMSFNPDPTKQAEEILFSQKKKSPGHPPIYFNDVEVKRVSDHKHLGLTLDSKLSFAKHISEKISTARKGIGIIKHLAPYLPLKSRDQIFKMHIRPHLDYCDMIYHIPVKSKETSVFDSSRTLNYQMSALESTQYQAALAVSGVWKGTSRIKIYDQLGWETLDQRRIFRRLTQFYKIMNGLTPEYLRIPTPLLRGHLFGYRNTNVLETIFCRSDRYQNSFFPDSVTIWNELGPELRGSQSLSTFKKNLLSIYRPEKKSIFDIHDPKGIKWIFQLRVGLSPLKSHKKSHNFQDTPDDTCRCTLSAETSEHYLLHCPNFINYRDELFQVLNPIMFANNMRFLDDKNLVYLLLYGHVKLKPRENQSILKATINFIKKTSRFS